MVNDPVPGNLRDFIVRYIDSIAQLEALLLLRANPADEWTPAEVAARLYTSEQDAAEVLARLCDDALAFCNEGIYHFGCETTELRDLVDRLAEAYSQQLIPVTNMIHAKPRRIRQFADAFKFRKDK
jgi:hypothetical protein